MWGISNRPWIPFGLSGYIPAFDVLNRKAGQEIEGRGSLEYCNRSVAYVSLIISMLYGEYPFILSEAI